MNSFARILILLLAVQLLLAVILPKMSYSLELSDLPSLNDAVQLEESNSQKEDPAQPRASDAEKPQNGVSLSDGALRDVKDSSSALADFSQVDHLEETIPASEEPVIPVHELNTTPNTFNVVDTSEIENYDSSTLRDSVELLEVETLPESAETPNEGLADSIGKLTDDIDLAQEHEKLESAIDAAKPDPIIRSVDETESLQDVLDDDIGNLGKISDWDIVEELAPAIATSVIETEESAITAAEREVQVISDEILRETIDTVQETIKQTDIAFVGDIIDEWEASTTVEEIEIPDGLGAEKIQDEVLQSLTVTDSLLTQSIDETAETYDDVTEGNRTDGTAISSLQELVSSLSSAGSRVKQVALNQEQYHDVKIVSNPKLTQEEQVHIIEEALNAEGLRDWSDGGWKVVGMDFIGVTEPQPKWETAIVYLHLPDGSGTPPERCEHGWQAVINIRLDVGKVSEAGMPTLSSHECSSAIVLEEPGDDALPVSAGITPSFVIAETDDVMSSRIHGSAAFLNTPSFNSTVFQSMDSYVAFLLNQKWSTSPIEHMTQIGWLMSSIEGCTDCGSQHIPADSATLAFTDSSVFGNLEAHRIPLFEWEKDEELVAGTWCNDESKYTIWAQYTGKLFNHNTNISCDSPDNDSKVSNSMFLENWNTAESSSWTDNIGRIEAHSAVTFRTDESKQEFSQHSWERSTNEEQDCTGLRQLTATVEGDLTSGKTAKWTNLNSISPAC